MRRSRRSSSTTPTSMLHCRMSQTNSRPSGKSTTIRFHCIKSSISRMIPCRSHTARVTASSRVSGAPRRAMNCRSNGSMFRAEIVISTAQNTAQRNCCCRSRRRSFMRAASINPTQRDIPSSASTKFPMQSRRTASIAPRYTPRAWEQYRRSSASTQERISTTSSTIPSPQS